MDRGSRQDRYFARTTYYLAAKLVADDIGDTFSHRARGRRLPAGDRDEAIYTITRMIKALEGAAHFARPLRFWQSRGERQPFGL
jgi:hypothetical protein